MSSFLEKFMHLCLVFFYLHVTLTYSQAEETCFSVKEVVSKKLSASDEKVVIQSFGYLASSILSYIVSILLEEKYGVSTSIQTVSTFKPDFTRDVTYIEKLRRGEHHLLIQDFYSSDVQPALLNGMQEGELINNGFLGYIEDEGFYIPDYMVKYDPSLINYQSLQDSGVIKAFQIKNFTNVVPKKKQWNDLHEKLENSTQSLTDMQIIADKIEVLRSFDPDYLIPMQEVFWNSKFTARAVIKNLNLKINVTGYEPYNYDPLVNKRVKEDYAARRPFLLYFSTPNEFQASLSEVNLVRIQLPSVSSQCMNAKSIEDWACDTLPLLNNNIVVQSLKTSPLLRPDS
eukprot:Awhi_evm1s5610